MSEAVDKPQTSEIRDDVVAQVVQHSKTALSSIFNSDGTPEQNGVTALSQTSMYEFMDSFSIQAGQPLLITDDELERIGLEIVKDLPFETFGIYQVAIANVLFTPAFIRIMSEELSTENFFATCKTFYNSESKWLIPDEIKEDPDIIESLSNHMIQFSSQFIRERLSRKYDFEEDPDSPYSELEHYFSHALSYLSMPLQSMILSAQPQSRPNSATDL